MKPCIGDEGLGREEKELYGSCYCWREGVGDDVDLLGLGF